MNSKTTKEKIMTERLYKVGVFPFRRKSGKTSYNAYTMYYNKSWDGCYEYEVIALSGKEAKQKAICLHKQRNSELQSNKIKEGK